jgi:hypothetical protein
MMVIIRAEQMNVFEQVALGRFEDEMVAHSKDFAPRVCDGIEDEQLRLVIHRAIQRANAYNLTSRGPVRLFIEMVFLFGSSFDTDPQYSWAAKILHATDDQRRRAEQLFAEVLAYQQMVDGPDAARTPEALRDLSALAWLPGTFASDDFVTGMRQILTRVFPRKAAYIGEEGLTTLIHEAITEARKYCFSTVREIALVTVLMLTFGHGCTTDLLWPWIAQTLQDEQISEPSARAKRLEQRALTFVQGSP